MNLDFACTPNTTARRRYNRRFFPMMTTYAVFIIGIALFFKHYHPTGVLAYILATLPAIPLVGTIFIEGLYLMEEQDEFLRTIRIQAMLWGIGATLAITTVWGFLELLVNVPHFELYLIYPAFLFFVGIATLIIRRRYS